MFKIANKIKFSILSGFNGLFHGLKSAKPFCRATQSNSGHPFTCPFVECNTWMTAFVIGLDNFVYVVSRVRYRAQISYSVIGSVIVDVVYKFWVFIMVQIVSNPVCVIQNTVNTNRDITRLGNITSKITFGFSATFYKPSYVAGIGIIRKIFSDNFRDFRSLNHNLKNGFD